MGAFLSNENYAFEKEEIRVKDVWTAYITDGGAMEGPEKYITLK